MHHTHENDLPPALTTPAAEPARAPRRRGRLLASFGLVAVLTAALLGAVPATSTPATAAPSAPSVAAVQISPTVAVASSKAAKRKAKKRALKVYQAKVKRLAKKNPRAAAKKMMRNRGYTARHQRCVIKLWNKESNWRWYADNPSSSAYGIPQALPGSKMRSAGRDWRTNPVTQIKWGLRYIKDRHGTPCGAWNHSKRRGWY